MVIRYDMRRWCNGNTSDFQSENLPFKSELAHDSFSDEKIVLEKPTQRFGIQKQLFVNPNQDISLIETSFDGIKRDMFLSHYPKSKSIVGRRILYDIYYKGNHVGLVGVGPVAVIFSHVFKYIYGDLKLNRERKIRYYDQVYNNNIFRLMYSEKNLASRILSFFRKQIKVDMKSKYNVDIKAIISMTYGINENEEERTGKCYRADNWKYFGITAGKKKKINDFGKDEKGNWIYDYEHIKTNRKHIFCYKYPDI